MKKFKVGVIGCGAISDTYLSNMSKEEKLKYIFEPCALADININAAKAQAEKYGVKKYYSSIDELLEDDEVELVLNLTNPWAHYDINKKALENGKHIYSEKPLALTADEAQELTELAEAKGLALGCAPDVYMGSGQQTTRQAIEAGLIGTPVTADAYIMMNVPRTNYMSEGIGGQQLDMGPYFVAALVNLFGPVVRVSGAKHKVTDSKFVDDVSSEKYGEKFAIDAYSTVTGILEFNNGVIATLTTTNDGYYYGPKFEIHGTKASFISSDPNMFTGDKFLREAYEDGKKDYLYPDKFPYREEHRGLGMADMMISWSEGREWRANGHFAAHIIDVLNSIIESADTGTRIDIRHQCKQPEPIADVWSANPIDPSVKY